MAVGEASWPEIYTVDGVRLGVAAAGIKYENRDDLLLMEISEGSSVAGVFTQNDFCAAPVLSAKKNLSEFTPGYFIINSGNANACTGEPGDMAVEACLQAVAEAGATSSAKVLPFSTGVIGEVLPAEKVVKALPQAFASLSEENWRLAAEAIMTTDTRPKAVSRKIDIDGESITITGIAKGAGMIRPNMATMLAFIATDAKLCPQCVSSMSRVAANRSFNRITIDGDTSTNDACMLIATGKSKAGPICEPGNDNFKLLQKAITECYQSLAQQIVRDGEGATKFVSIHISCGASSEEALSVGYAIANSPLVKTALFASDPNWGRLVAAIGNAGLENLDVAGINVLLDEVLVVEKGKKAASYTEEKGQNIFNKSEFSINVSLGRGGAEETVWTSDLSHEYVTINAEYRT
ncbi:glutamate N-acetyltransferase [Alteromonadaceae bacterium Bs31]|nr:glutamate N-acetyltransferase [Alteromonadaceae bacterium Bs31]